MEDPTYSGAIINKHPIWQLAFILSEVLNDRAPIGWSKYIGAAKCLSAYYDFKQKEATDDKG